MTPLVVCFLVLGCHRMAAARAADIALCWWTAIHALRPQCR